MTDMFEEFIGRLHDYFALNEPLYYYYLDQCIMERECGEKLMPIINDLYIHYLFFKDITVAVTEIRKFLTEYYGIGVGENGSC